MKLSAHRLGFGWNARLVLAGVLFLLAGGPALWAQDDGPGNVQFTTNAVTVDQSAGVVNLTVVNTDEAACPITVEFATQDGTATSPLMYTANSGTLPFGPAFCQVGPAFIQITLGTGTPPGTSTYFTVVLSNPVNAPLGANSTVTVTITNAGSPPPPPPLPTVQFSSPTYSANQSSGSAPITVTLSAIPTATVTVNYSTADGTAVAGTNYTATSGVLTFNPGDPNPNYPNPPSQTFTMPILRAHMHGQNRALNLALSLPSGATLGTPSSAALTIIAQGKPPAPSFVQINATVPSTPPKTRRKLDGMPAGPDDTKILNNWPLVGDPLSQDLVFSSTHVIQEESDGALRFSSAIFAKPNALVLFQNGEDVKLSVVVTNLGDVKLAFQVVRDPLDDVNIGRAADLPTVTSTGATTATLKMNGKGSFQVLAFHDKNNNGKWDKGEKGLTMYVILVRAEPTDGQKGDNCKANKDNMKAFFFPDAKRPLAFRVGTGGFDVAKEPEKAALFFNAQVTLIGGGIDGRRGLDRVFFGWANNITSLVDAGYYQKGAKPKDPQRTWDRIYVVNADKAEHTLGDDDNRVFWAGDRIKPVPATGMSFPLLDTRRQPAGYSQGKGRDGGIDITLSTSPQDGRGAAENLDTIGQKRTIQAVDSPSTAAPIDHPITPTDRLIGLNFTHDYSVRLIGWTNSGGSPAPTPDTANTVGFRTFSHVRYANWKVAGGWTIVPPAKKGGEWKHIPNEMGNPPIISIAGFVQGQRGEYNPATPTAGTAFEVRTPSSLGAQAFYAR